MASVMLAGARCLGVGRVRASVDGLLRVAQRALPAGLQGPAPADGTRPSRARVQRAAFESPVHDAAVAAAVGVAVDGLWWRRARAPRTPPPSPLLPHGAHEGIRMGLARPYMGDKR